MQKLYFLLNECLKSYHIFRRYDPIKAKEYLDRINEYRIHIVQLALQRQMFIEQLNILPNSSGYKTDVFFTHDDIDCLVSRMIASLEDTVKLSLVQQGTREILYTRESVAWQQLASQVQDSAVNNGQKIPFDLPQEIYLEKSQTLDIGVTNQVGTDRFVFVHGANLKDDPADNFEFFKSEILSQDLDGVPNLPKPQLVPILFQFPAGGNAEATAVDGGSGIYSVKSERSVILTEVSVTTPDCRLSLSDKGRNIEICTNVESLGIAGQFDNQYTVYYPLPYPHLLPAQDRLQLRGLNGSNITGSDTTVGVVQTICFRGFTI